jgi:hypothetical protein
VVSESEKLVSEALGEQEGSHYLQAFEGAQTSVAVEEQVLLVLRV